MEQVELRELSNNVEIVGLLKTNGLEEKTTKSGKEAVMGNVTIEVSDGTNTHNIRVSAYAGKFKKNGDVSKLFTSMQTVATEYKDIDTYGREEADMVSITGSISGNDYVGQDGNVRSSNQIRGVFFKRLDDKSVKQHAYATVESIVNGYTEAMDAEGFPAGDLNVEAYTIGYNGTVIELKDMTIGKELAAQFSQLYVPGSTGALTIKLNNYAVEDEAPAEVAETHGFGSTDKVSNNTFSSYVANYEIIGGDVPMDNGLELTPEEIDEVLTRRKQQLSQLTVAAPTQQAAPTGFGGNGMSQPAVAPKPVTKSPFTDMSNSDMPSF